MIMIISLHFINVMYHIDRLCMLNDPCIRSDQSLSRVQLFATPWIAARRASLSITISRSSLRLTSIEPVMPSSHPCSVVPFSSCPQSLPASDSFPMSQLFPWGGQRVSALASFLPKKSWADLLQNGLMIRSPCSPRDSQESSPTPQFKGINSSALSFLHSPTLTSIQKACTRWAQIIWKGTE